MKKKKLSTITSGVRKKTIHMLVEKQAEIIEARKRYIDVTKSHPDVIAAQKAYETAKGEYDAMCKEQLGLIDGEPMNVVQLAALVDRLV